MSEDGTERLCRLLYGEVRPWQYLGGADANMLHAAADEIKKLRTEVERLTGRLQSQTVTADLLRARLAEREADQQ